MKKAKKVLTRNCHCSVCDTIWKIHPKDLRKASASVNNRCYVLPCKLCHKWSIKWVLYD